MGQIFVKASRRAKAHTRRSARLKGLSRRIDQHVVKMGGYHSHVRSQQLLKKTKNRIYQARVTNILENIHKRRAGGKLSSRRDTQLRILAKSINHLQYRIKF